MTKSEFYREVERILSAPANSVQGQEALTAVGSGEWDSFAVLEFIDMAQSRAGTVVDGKIASKAKTVPDLVALVAGRLAD